MLDSFDEFGEGDLPPDAPTQKEAIEIVCKAAQDNPEFKSFLEKWFPLPVNNVALQPGQRPGRETLVTADQDPVEDQHNRRLQELAAHLATRSKEEQRHTKEYEAAQYTDLLSNTIDNYEAYQTKRLDAQLDVIREANVNIDLPLHESEDIFNALHFDIQQGRPVELDRAIKHRHSVKSSMKQMIDRELVNLELQLKNLQELPVDDTADELEYILKSEIIKTTKLAEATEEQIDVLRHEIPERSSHRKKKALEKVYLQLLSILDELVPEASDTQHKPEAPVDIKGLESAFSRAQLNLQQTLSRLQAKVSATKEDILQSDSRGLLPALQALDLSILDKTEELSTNRLDLQHEEEGMHNILSSFKRVKALEDKIHLNRVRSQIAEVQTNQAISSALLEQAFAKRSMESPLLATRDLYGVQDVVVLSNAWREASHGRSNETEAVFDPRMEKISECLATVQRTLDTTELVMQDVEDLERAGIFKQTMT